jgi:NADPH-dependent ferric siderophore reductase
VSDTDAAQHESTDAAASDPVVALMAETGEDMLYRLNEDFADSLLMVGRVLGGHASATRTTIVSMDARGVDAVATTPEGEHAVRVDFAEPVTDGDQLTSALLEIVVRARELSGEDGESSAESAMEQLSRIRTFLTQVAAVRDVTPHLREITFRGGDLATFEPLGPDTFLYLLLPPPGRSEVGIDQSFTWEAHALMAPEDQPRGGYYTLRRWRPEVAELDIWMVLHGDAGYASAWAARAQVGDQVALWGPRTAYGPPEGTDHLLLVADETGLPAVAVILEQLPVGVSATVVAEADDAEDRPPLPEAPGAQVHWVYRHGAEAGTTTLLADAVRALPALPGTPYVWGGGESRTMTAVRRHVRDERGLDREQVSLVAYWRHAGPGQGDSADGGADDRADRSADGGGSAGQ